MRALAPLFVALSCCGLSVVSAAPVWDNTSLDDIMNGLGILPDPEDMFSSEQWQPEGNPATLNHMPVRDEADFSEAEVADMLINLGIVPGPEALYSPEQWQPEEDPATPNHWSVRDESEIPEAEVSAFQRALEGYLRKDSGQDEQAGSQEKRPIAHSDFYADDQGVVDVKRPRVNQLQYYEEARYNQEIRPIVPVDYAGIQTLASFDCGRQSQPGWSNRADSAGWSGDAVAGFGSSGSGLQHQKKTFDDLVSWSISNPTLNLRDVPEKLVVARCLYQTVTACLEKDKERLAMAEAALNGRSNKEDEDILSAEVEAMQVRKTARSDLKRSIFDKYGYAVASGMR